MKSGRNDPCPCGSGKKYKKCCWGKGSSAIRTQPLPDINAMLTKAWAQYQAGHLHKAAALYQAILDIRPNTFDAIHTLSEIASTLGQFKAAEELLRRAIKIQPKRADLHNNLGFKLQQQNRPEEAEVALTESIRLDPKLINPYINRSNVHILLGRVDDSIADSRKALKLDPENTRAMRNLLFASNYSNKLTPEEIYNEHVAFGRRYAEIARPNITATHPSLKPGNKIRIGYLSPDFRTHPVAFFLEPT
ncbi:MAG TPA: tetratricopeptide repeat protein, partial [Xanthomonadales bacterium]